MTTSIHVLPYDVTVKDRVMNDETGIESVNIHLWCLDRESKPWLIRVPDFPTFCYIELPQLVNGHFFEWTQRDVDKVMDYIKKVMDENKPTNYAFNMLQKLYYYQGDRKYPMIFVQFRTLEALNHCKNLLNKPKNVPGYGSMTMNVYEAHIDIVRKLFTVRDANFCSWLLVKGEEIPFDSERRISTAGTSERPMREMIISFNDINQERSKEAESWFVSPRIVAFDIETYTDNFKAMPNSLVAKHVCNIISCIYYEVGKPDSKKRYVFVLGDSEPVEGSMVECFDTEVKMIEAFCKLIIELDPEIISGYNIFAYDYPYLDNRLKTKFKDWPQMGRIMNENTEMSTMKWKSGAYGYNIINILNMSGRLSIDLIQIVKRDYKLDKYSLDFVSKTFIGRQKNDVEPVEMFMAYEHQFFIYQEMRRYLMERVGRAVTNDELLSLMRNYEEADERARILVQRYYMARKEITRIVAYCIVDSDLVVDLFEKLNVWLGLNALSSVVGVSIMQLFTRGQQIRCLSQVYDKCYRKRIVMDKRIKDKVFYNGGFVFEPKPGLYDAVVCLDFASLYPSIMRAYNICFTTLVSPDLFDKVNDDQAATIEVEQEEPLEGVKAMKDIDADALDFNTNDDDEEDDSNKKTITKMYKYKWVNKATRYGVLPEIQDHLVGSRNVIKKELAALEDELEECSDPKRLAEIKLLLVLKDKYSNALKVSANSLYGFLGAQEGGVLSLIEAAMCITSKGRNLIMQVNSYVEDKYQAEVVYGDSVTGDTPVLIKKNGIEEWVTIEDVVNWNEYEDIDEKQRMIPLNIQVWSDKGWTGIKQVIRHKTHKKIYRIMTESGLIHCTEDHSLLRPDGREVRPEDVDVGFELMHVDLPPSKDLNRVFLINYSLFDDYTLEAARTYQVYNSIHTFGNGRSRIISIQYVGKTNDYVYDFETENHHFAAGVGRMIVHNTDSSMINLHITDFKQAYAAGLALADEISGTPEKKLPDGTIIPAKVGLFPPPLKIEFEKCLRILCIKKKKYAGLYIGKDGEFVREKNKDGSLGELKILKRGIIVARRDTAKIVHKTYNKLLNMILTREPVYDGFTLIMNTLDDLINDRLPVRENLSIIRSLGDNYKSASYFMKVFGDELIRVGKPANPSDRLEYVIVRTKSEEAGEKDVKLGLKMRLVDMYEDSWNLKRNDKQASEKKDRFCESSLLLGEADPLNKQSDSVAVYEPEKIDYEYYIGHIMMASLDQLFSIGYMKELEKFREIGYTPQFCRRKAQSVVEPIAMIVKFLDDYKTKGYTIEHLKPLFVQIKDHYRTLLTS